MSAKGENIPALEYARRGWPVLSLKSGQKAPYGEFVPHGHKDATGDLELINAWWSAYPELNVGVCVGSETDLLVIDVDAHDADGKVSLRSLEKENGKLPETYTNETAGSGFHYFFKFPEGLKNVELKAQLAPGIDLKHNGYVVMPPSKVNGKAYKNIKDCEVAELPPEWVELCKKEEPTYQEWVHIRRRANPNGESFCEGHDLSMRDVLPLPADATRTGDGYLCKHPIHGATGGGNLFVNERLDLWCCYRHNTGGDALTWIAVREGFIECSDAGPLDKDTFKRCLEVLRREGLISDAIEAIPETYHQSVEDRAQWLIRHPKQLIAYYRSVIDDYHQGEWALKTTMFRQVHRIAYHSTTTLLHSDMTGPSRGGKTSLMLRFLTLLPAERKVVITTATPKAIWYKTLQWTDTLKPQVDKKTGEDETDERGNVLMKKVRVKKSDPTFYAGKVIVILELSEMKDFGVLKALADEYEVGEFTHSTVIDQKSVELKIEGPRCVMTTSVTGIQNDAGKQVLNRFIQTPLDEPTERGTAAKLEMVADSDLDESAIYNDERLPALKRALELLYAEGYRVVVVPPSDRVRKLTKEIDRRLAEDGFNITQIRGFHTFALNGAFEKRFARGDPETMQIQEEDILEAWYILTTFGNFARGNLTRAEFKLLDAIPTEVNDATDASDLRETTGLGVATISDALRVKDDPIRGQGKFLQYGYVNYFQGDGRGSRFYRVSDGTQAVKKITQRIEVDGRILKPLNPCPFPYNHLLDEIPDSLNSAKFDFASESQRTADDSKKEIEGRQSVGDHNSINSVNNNKKILPTD
ncbi:MAG: bifunctional DNA primase/polymerase [Halobacteriota archaeon]